MLIVLAQSAISVEPRQAAFHHPPSRQHHKSLVLGRLFDNCQIYVVCIANIVSSIAGISLICPDLGYLWVRIGNSFTYVVGTVTVLDTRAMYHDTHEVAHRVDETMPLAPLYLFFPRQSHVHHRLRSSSPFDCQSRHRSAADHVQLASVSAREGRY